MMTSKSDGLAGVVAGETAISTVGQDRTGLTYRGYPIEELAQKSTFEETAYLLLYNRLPTDHELTTYRETLVSLRRLPQRLRFVLELIPHTAHPMDVLRTTCSMLGSLEPETDFEEAPDLSARLLAIFPAALLYWHHFHNNHKKIEVNISDESTAGYFLHLLHQEKPNPELVKALDTSLILYAEHEFNASTFAARVTAATLSDYYSAICSAIGTLRGPLHGGANEEAYHLIQKFTSEKAAEIGVKSMLEQKERIMGFGHRVYKDQDPRSPIIKEIARHLSSHFKQEKLFHIAERIEQVVWESKKLPPNLDFYSAIVYAICDIPVEMFTPLFAIARTIGWTAHIIEQRANNKLIRPSAHYIGEQPRKFMALQER